MISLFTIFLSVFAYSQAPHHWNHMTSLMDRHEFYANNEMVVKPKGSWQTLFSVVYTDIELKEIKDCVFFRVPGVESGILKVKTIESKDQCEKYILSPGDREWKEIKSLQFATSPEGLILYMTFPRYKNEKWDISILNRFEIPTPKMHMSSAELKSPDMIFLAPQKDMIVTKKKERMEPHTLCHNINEDCEELKPSSCSLCEEGWYEIPNGCHEGPKFCGRLNCGGKGEPACRRGMVWQRNVDKDFDCRVDSSFAYCMKGLSISCQGRSAYCR